MDGKAKEVRPEEEVSGVVGGSGQPSEAVTLADLDALYRRARAHFEAEDVFADRARNRVVGLQAGDPATAAHWRRLVDASVSGFDALYARMGVLLTDADLDPESRYNAALPGVVADLRAAGLLVDSDGAQVVFPPGFRGRDGRALPLIVRKSDGGFGYAATDLAEIRHRVEDLGAERIVYVVDARQSLHFDQVFAVARQAGWLPGRVETRHVAFGTVLGADGRPLRTRSGDTVPLAWLLDRAEAAAARIGDDPAVARAVGIGAVKYADLSGDIARDYAFDLARMVATDGDTGPYLQYAHARVCSLLARAGAGERPTAQGGTAGPDAGRARRRRRRRIRRSPRRTRGRTRRSPRRTRPASSSWNIRPSSTWPWNWPGSPRS